MWRSTLLLKRVSETRELVIQSRPNDRLQHSLEGRTDYRPRVRQTSALERTSINNVHFGIFVILSVSVYSKILCRFQEARITVLLPLHMRHELKFVVLQSHPAEILHRYTKMSKKGML